MTSCSECATAVEEGVAACVQCGAAIEQGTTQTQLDLPAWPIYADPVFPAPKFGGSLILVALGLAISPLRHLDHLFTNLMFLWSSRYRAILAVMPTLPGIILYEAIINTVFLAAMIGLNVLFYRKRKSFPGLMILYLVGQIVPVAIDAVLVQGFKPAAALAIFIGSVLPAMILIPYYLRSERVKLTFVN